MPPLVTVYIPTRNRVASLGRAIDSVLAQSLSDLEVIIVDDASSDDTVELLKEYAARDTRVSWISNDQNRGACYSRNAAIKAARGTFVTGLDDDDEFSPDHLAALEAYWRQRRTDPQFSGVVYPLAVCRDERGLRRVNRPPRVEADSLFDNNFVGGAVFAPRQVYVDAGLFDEDMPAWQDLEFYYRMLRKYGPAECAGCATYVIDNTPRSDRISRGGGERIREACRLMYEKHGEGNGRRMQRLLLNHVFGDFYEITPSVRDLFHFVRLGWWPWGIRTLVSRMRRR